MDKRISAFKSKQAVLAMVWSAVMLFSITGCQKTTDSSTDPSGTTLAPAQTTAATTAGTTATTAATMVVTKAPMPEDYDYPVAELPEHYTDVLGVYDTEYDELPVCEDETEIVKYILHNFLHDDFDMGFLISKDLVPDEGSGNVLLQNSLTNAYSYYPYSSSFQLYNMITYEDQDTDMAVLAKLTLLYEGEKERDQEAYAEALEYLAKNPVPEGGFTDYESEKAYCLGIHDFICKKITYSPIGYNMNEMLSGSQYENCQEAWNVLAEDQTEAVCAGYARAFALIAQTAGIHAVWVSGNETEQESHAWNMVYPCDGSEPVIVDCTWDDTSGEDVIGQTEVSQEWFYLSLDEDFSHEAYDYTLDFLDDVND